jgi:hypothetical protein
MFRLQLVSVSAAKSEPPTPRSRALARAALLTVKICQPSHEFTFGVGMTFVSYPLVLTPVV